MDTNVPPLRKKLLAIDTYWERNSVFFNGDCLGISTTAQGRLDAQEELANPLSLLVVKFLFHSGYSGDRYFFLLCLDFFLINFFFILDLFWEKLSELFACF